MTRFIQFRAQGSGNYEANIRIDPQARLAGIGELSANNNVRGIKFSVPTNCITPGASTAYDIALSNLRMDNDVLCKGLIRWKVSNLLRTRVPVNSYSFRIRIWVDKSPKVDRTYTFRNQLRNRRHITLSYNPTVIPRNRRSFTRVRVDYIRQAASRDTRSANNSVTRLFRCDPTRT